MVVIDNLTNASELINSKMELFKALSVELSEIRNLTEMTVRKNADLLAQIALGEARQEYVNGALAEGERIAQEITGSAELRVEKISANAQTIILPQREQIAILEQEIAELSAELNSGNLKAKESAPKITEMASIRREFSLRRPQELDVAEEIMESYPSVQNEPYPQPTVRREYSLRNPQELDVAEEIMEINPPVQSEPYLQPIVRREYSLRKPQELDIDEEMGRINQLVQTDPTPQLLTHQGPYLREHQAPGIAIDYPEPNHIEMHAPKQQSILFQEHFLSEPMVEEISNYNLALSLVEQDEPNMHLDVFVDTCFFEAQGEQVGQIQKHAWQVKIEVEVPRDNQKFVGYGKVSSAVTSTLQRYDAIVLNDIFPFDIIEPNTENIAMYFYNSLQDTLNLMDLVLKRITLWESQTLVMQVNRRNMEFDDLLQKGDDILQNMRGLLAAREHGGDKTDTGRRLGHIFKK